ncbi:LruC domain-containing protein [Polaribacter sp. KT25b]|uniref:LruC domain-containing protein n=1 Tax=Polaribacter sp. KT25b TaxID=1855336 RepID=UPI00087A3412|nr:LruC domain-containing protein [Polaribacter sp. KT25b]SDS46953.1 LruC domain-containing protein [Polaribacter sp. KT25b]
MKSTINNFLKISFSILLLYGCNNFSEPEVIVAVDEDSNVLSIPAGFDFSTYHDVTISITENDEYAKYDIYAYSDELYDAGTETFENESGETVTETVYKSDMLENLIFSGVAKNGGLIQTINLPKFYTKVYIRRNEQLSFSSSIKDIVDQKVAYNSIEAKNNLQSKSTSDVTDYLYSVNGSGQLFQVDPLTGTLTDLSTMPIGSWTCAIDQENKTLYSIGRSSPFPLMKYSILNDTWETVANLGIGGPRLDFNTADGLLYFSNRDKLYTFNPSTGALLNTWKINGLHDVGGGDLAFADDGTLFVCTFSGLYKLNLDTNNEYQSTRISSDNLPFKPTSMTFDSNQELWLADSSSSADLIIMDTQTGGWKYQYGASANNNTDFGRSINDLTTFRVYADVKDETDSDGDGIFDQDDAFPNDAEAAFESFTPSKYGKGTIAFEDLWPSTGDYDFNDAALSYQAIAVLNSDNLAVRLDFICNIKANGAGFTNGIGFEIEGLDPSKIESVTGTVFTQNFISLNANGTEANQENAVIILTDDVDNILNETTISIKFVTPISTADLGVAPFNPFIIANKVRSKEIHLPYRKVTSLGVSGIEIDGVNKDADGNFISDNGFPWAISIIHDFKVPKEKIDITDAYNFFSTWAESGGTTNVDWYKDNPGNRNEDLIDN